MDEHGGGDVDSGLGSLMSNQVRTFTLCIALDVATAEVEGSDTV